MTDLQLQWLIPTLLEILGLAMILSALGLSYSSAITIKNSPVVALVENAQAFLLGSGVIVFTIGIGFTQAGWVIKGVAITLAILGLTWTYIHWKRTSRAQIPRQKPTIKATLIFGVKTWFVVFVVLFLVWAIHLGWHSYHLFGLAKNLQENIYELKVESLVPVIGEVADDFSEIERNLSPLFPIFNALEGVPGVGPYLGQLEPLLTYANGLAEAGKEIAIGVEPLLVTGAEDKSDLPLPERACQVLESGQVHFTAASQAINLASDARNRIRSELLPPSIRSIFTRLDGRFDLLVAGAQFLQSAPGLLGAGQPQNFLILAQNRDELRATGGFISGIGLVSLHEGKIEQFMLGDSYAVDDFTKSYPAPPDALHRFMLADYWVTRDANWSPDFPITARQAQSLYTMSTGIETQGVIAFNQSSLKRILEAIGSVQLPGIDEPITSENVEIYMQQAWAPEPQEGLSQDWWVHRKDFMQQLGNVIIEKVLESQNQDQFVSLGKAIVDLLDRRQILLYFNDTIAQEALQKTGWSGALHSGNGDYLYVIDSNVGFNKVDSVITRSVKYKVDLSDLEHPLGKVTVSYQHRGTGSEPCVQVASYGNGTYQDMQERCYWDYWRIYTPDGSALISSTALPVSADELLNGEGWSGQVETMIGESDTHVFAGMLVLPISNFAQVDIAYTLSPSIIHTIVPGQFKYSLWVDVQAGLEGLPFVFKIILPPSSHLYNESTTIKTEGANLYTWQGSLDRSFRLSFSFSHTD